MELGSTLATLPCRHIGTMRSVQSSSKSNLPNFSDRRQQHHIMSALNRNVTVKADFAHYHPNDYKYGPHKVIHLDRAGDT